MAVSRWEKTLPFFNFLLHEYVTISGFEIAFAGEKMANPAYFKGKKAVKTFTAPCRLLSKPI